MMTELSLNEWLTALCITVAIVGLVACFDEWRLRRRHNRQYRINPMFRVGGDAKDRP